METYRIAAFDRKAFALPVQRRSYKDDIVGGAFQPAALMVSGRQSKGIHERLGRRRSCTGHVAASLKEPFHFAPTTPLPSAIRRAAEFSRDTPPDQLLRFWDAQLSSLSSLVGECRAA